MNANATAELGRIDGIAVLMFSNPPVNVLSHPLPFEAAQKLTEVARDASLQGLIIGCAGDSFVAGADIYEPGRGNPPILRDLIAQLEALDIPSVACIHGTVLSRGFEFALGATYRVALESTQIGLPEVKLGLIPGAGGTVRTTYLAGAEATLKLAGGGDPIPAARAMELGLIDAVFEDDLITNGVAFLNGKIARGELAAPVRERRHAMPAPDMDRLEKLASDLARKERSPMPKVVLSSIRNALTLPFDDAMREERRLFDEAVASPLSAAMRHIFFAERQASRPRGTAAEAEARPVKKIGVIGAGTMGGGIAMAFANAGFEVVIREPAEEALRKGLERVEANYKRSVERGSLSQQEASARLKRIFRTVAVGDLADCDLIVEAALEDMAVKKAIFSELDAVARKGAILATNTSYLDINQIARATSRPSDVMGLHFFSPANVMKLIEIVAAAETAPDAVATALQVARRIDKQAVVVGVCHGFVGNRMLAKRNSQLTRLVLEGAAPEAIDKAFRDFGWPMGPCEMGDLAGLDISWRNRKALGVTDPLLDRLCELGRYGQKTGRGWYRYDESGKGQADPAVVACIEGLAAEQGIERREIPASEIIERTHGPLVDEGYGILKEGIAARASDIDVVWVNGYGFPRTLGGPMYWHEHLRDKQDTHSVTAAD